MFKRYTDKNHIRMIENGKNSKSNLNGIFVDKRITVGIFYKIYVICHVRLYKTRQNNVY